MSFLSTSEHTVDDKGRIAIPSRYRGMFGSSVIITKGPDPCLEVYTPEGHEKHANDILSGKGNSEADRRLRRALYSQAAAVDIDKQGRILIPAQMRERVGIEGAVVIAGSGANLEIWPAAAWSIEARAADAGYAQLLESPESRP